GPGHPDFVKSLLKIDEKALPFCRCYQEMLVRLLQGAARVLWRPAGGPAHHFRDEVLKACRGNAVMRLVDPWVCIQARIEHEPIDEVIYNGGDAIDTARASSLALLWQIYSCRCSLQIHFRQCGHRCGGNRAKASRTAAPTARPARSSPPPHHPFFPP